METIRNRLIHHGASVNISDGVVRIRLNESFPYQHQALSILNQLRQLVRIQPAFTHMGESRTSKVEGN